MKSSPAKSHPPVRQLRKPRECGLFWELGMWETPKGSQNLRLQETETVTETVTRYVFVCCHLLGDLGTAEVPAVEEMLTHSFSRYL